MAEGTGHILTVPKTQGSLNKRDARQWQNSAEEGAEDNAVVLAQTVPPSHRNIPGIAGTLPFVSECFRNFP